MQNSPLPCKVQWINIYFPHNVLQTVYVVSACELSICYYIFFWFFYNVNIHKLWEHILKLIVPSIILASPSTILFVVREITRMQLESVWECANIYYSIQCMCLENCTKRHHATLSKDLYIMDKVRQNWLATGHQRYLLTSCFSLETLWCLQGPMVVQVFNLKYCIVQ